MRKDLVTMKPIYSSFLSCDKDIQKILKLLFVTSKPYSDILKRLLIINSKDCLDSSNTNYIDIVNQYSLGDMIDKGYIRLGPKISRGTHEEIKTYIEVSLDNFMPNAISSQYRDYIVSFNIICYNDAWMLNNYKTRPLLICGYIDGILNSLSKDNPTLDKTFQSQMKLTGVGEYEFLSCVRMVLNEDLSLYRLSYTGTHFTEDMQQLGWVHTK